MRNYCVSLAAILFVVSAAPSAHAQLGQLNAGGNTGGANATGAAAAGSGGQGAGQGAGGTTEGPGGVTGQGPGTSAAQDGGLAGGNTATTFVGQNQAGGFVGGGVGTLFNNSRQFQALIESQLATGGTRETSGTPRSIPTSLRIAFDFPAPDAATLLMGPAGPEIRQVANVRPELRSVNIRIDAHGVAILSGSTPDAAAKRLAGNLVRMRPGVRKIDNQIRLATP